MVGGKEEIGVMIFANDHGGGVGWFRKMRICNTCDRYHYHKFHWIESGSRSSCATSWIIVIVIHSCVRTARATLHLDASTALKYSESMSAPEPSCGGSASALAPEGFLLVRDLGDGVGGGFCGR